jgi:sulfatase maturation enzyme AslB (radical SAM superfamily)
MKDCFGNIYPDLEQLQFGATVTGKVFRVRVTTMGPGHRDRKLEVDRKEWENCQRCEDFRNCYDFSTARLAMQQAIAQI